MVRFAPKTTAILALLVFVSLGSVGTTGCFDSEGDPTQTEDRTQQQEPRDPTVELSEDAREPLEADQLAPTLSTVGPEGVVPQRFVVRFDRRVAGPGQLEPGPKTEWSIEPPLDVDPRFVDRNTVSFAPISALEPGATYRVTISALDVQKPPTDRAGETDNEESEETAPATQVLRPDKPWSFEFTTPDFGLVDVSPAVSSTASSRVQTTLTFSAPVEPAEVGRYAMWKVGGREVQASYSAGPTPTTVVASFRAPGSGADRSTGVSLGLAEGLPSRSGAVANAAQRSVEWRSGPPVSIKNVVLREGSSGFYFLVICDDAASGGSDYYWDSAARESYRLSDRCQPTTASAKELIDVSPDVDLRVSPAEPGFRILGDFQRRSYALRIGAGLQTVDGGVLTRSRMQTFDVPARDALVDIPASGRFITREMWKNLGVRHRNVDRLEVRVRHVPKDNLIFWMSGDSEDADERTSNLVVDTHVSVDGPPDEVATSWLNVEDLVGDPKPGVYEINLSASGKSAVARVMITDMNLVVKRSAAPPDAAWSKEVVVWARDMESNEAVEGADVRAIRKSGDTLARCTTGVDGGCRLKLPAKEVDPSPPFAIVAEKDDRITYLTYGELETKLIDDETHGEPYLTEKPYRATIYGDRDVYRPGETAHFVAVVRGENNRAPEAGMPLEMNLRDARGRLVRSTVRQTNAAGLVAVDETFPDLASTGRWRMELRIGDKDITDYTFNVEEFVPERMKVEASTEKADYAFDERVGVNVEARYLFGASADGSEVELDCRVQPTGFKPDQNADYSYGPLKLNEDYKPVALSTVTGTIGEDDTARLQCPSIDSGSSFETTGRVRANVAVFEAGSGRATRATTTATVHPEDYYIGLRAQTDEVKAGETYPVEGLIVDWKGQPVDAVDSVELEFITLEGEWTRYYDSERGRTRWKRHLRPAVEGTQTVTVDDDGRFRVEMTPGAVDDGYLIRATAGEARTELKFDRDRPDYWSRGPRETRDQTPRPQAPTSMHVDAPAPVQVGQPHTVHFTAPYKGHVLLTVETHRVLQYQWKEVSAGKNSWTFTLKDYHPNVYVGAFLIKDPHLESEEAFLPDRAFGVDQAPVKPEEYLREVSVETPTEVQPNEQLKVTVETDATGDTGGSNGDNGETWATVAAVDEGILSLTNYETPRPLDSLLARRALGVQTFDTVGWALNLPPRGQSSATGGGNGAGRRGRIMPVEPVALWSGLRRVPDDGKLTVNLDVPQYRGELRVMAQVIGPQRIGTAEARVKVRDPLSIQTTTPRFLTAGDRVQIPVFVSNMTDRDRNVQVNLRATELDVPGVTGAANSEQPLISLKNASTRRLDIRAGESATAVFVAEANRHGGAAEFHVTAKSGPLQSRDDSTVPFKAAGPTERQVKRLEISEGTTELSQHLTGWVPTSEDSTFWLTSLEHGRAFDHLKRLIRYPYGCIEQTSSSTRPLLHVSKLVERNDPAALAGGGELDAMVMHGVNRLLSMQTPSGGFAYWPGGSNPHPWGTAYATDILLEAEDQGYDVPRERVDRALSWMGNYVASQGAGGGGDSWLGTPGLAFMHFVLAGADRGRRADIMKLLRRLPERMNGETRERAYLLKAALYLSGDRRYADELKDPQVDSQTGGRQTGGDFYSHRRRRAMMLNIFVELFGAEESGSALARQVADDLETNEASRWYSTQELVWGVSALGKWYDEKASDVGDATLVADGTPVEPSVEADSLGPAWALVRASEYDSLQLKVQNSQADQLYLILSSEGVRQQPTVNWGADGLQVSREYLNRDGDPVDWRTHGLGDMVFTRVTIKNQTPDTIQNVALVDRLPAGWEIENPRLSGNRAPGFARSSDRWDAAHMNIRDDRLEVFGDLGPRQSRTFTYAARATLAGEFQIPPISAEAMYDPSIWGRQRGRRISINGPWAKFID